MKNNEDLEYVAENCQRIETYGPAWEFSEKEMKVLRDRFHDKLTYREIAEKRRMSKSTVRDIIKTAIQKYPGLQKPRSH